MICTTICTESDTAPAKSPKRSQYSGNLTFCVLRAKNLEKKDILGKSDPFVVVKYNNAEHSSPTMNNNQNPEWNFSQTFEIDGERPGKIEVQVFDDDYGAQDELGTAEFDVRDLVLADQSQEPIWINLENCASGTIQISSEFMPVTGEWTMKESVEGIGYERGPEFDRNVRKSFKRIIRTVDADGNVVEQVLDEPTMPAIEIPKTEMSRSVEKGDGMVRKSFKKIIRTVDAEGNVTEQVIEDDSTPTSWEMANVDLPGGMEMVASQSRVTSVKKTIDEFGNIISEDIQTRDLEGEVDFDQLTRSSGSPVKKTSVKTVKKTVTVFAEESDNRPVVETSTSSSSQRTITTVDSHGNVVREVVKDDEIDWDPEETVVKTSTKKVSKTIHHTLEGIEESPPTEIQKTSIQINQRPRFDEIIFVLHGAKDLENVDWVGSSDPYAVITFGSQCSRTKTIRDNLNPMWEHEVTFQVDERAPSHINIELFDENITRQDCLGNTSVEVAKIKMSGSLSEAGQKLSNCKSGDISFSAKYITKMRIPQSSRSVEGDDDADEDDDEILKKMDHLGLEKICLKRKGSSDSVGSNESTDGLLKEVTHRQGNLTQKIETLKKTIRKSMTPESLQSWEGSSEVVYSSQFESQTQPGQLFSRTFELLDNEGNPIPRCGGSAWQNVKYFHTSSQPFQNVTSLRAHFVTAFEPDVPEVGEEQIEVEGQSSVQYEESFNTAVKQSSYVASSDSFVSQSSSSTLAQHGSLPPSHGSLGLELLLSESGRERKAELTPTGEISYGTEQRSQVKEWVEPLISSSCLADRQFWRDDKSSRQSSSSTMSPDGCQQWIKGSHSQRSPVSHLVANQSLPSSPSRKPFVKQRTIVTSELFSSDEDRSRSLELIYSESEDDQKQKLSNIYRTASPAHDHEKLEKRKASFTQVKRVDRQLSDNELISGSSSPDLSKGTFSPQFTSSPLNPPSLSSVRGHKRVVESGFEEQIPAPEFGDDGMSAGKPDLQTTKTNTSSLQKQDSREISSGRERGPVREPSFIYDTSVEAFGSEGASIDDPVIESDFMGNEGNTKRSSDISILTKIASEIDLEPIDPFQAGADSLYLSGDFDLNEEDTETSPREKSNSVHVDFQTFDNLRIPLSNNRLPHESAEFSSPFINVPDSDTKRLSNVSTEGESKISSTPEGESYFMAREESFIKKVHEGELQAMAVEVSDYFSMDSIDDDLTVKPLVEHPEAEIEITDLRPGSDLVVRSVNQAPVSSFETIYDKIALEEMETNTSMTKEELLASLEDKFQGAVELPEYFSSFDDLCQISDMEESSVEEGRRWTAPAGTVEAPILKAEEFVVRLQPVAERTSGHWNELERLLEGQSGREKEADSSTKIEQQ